MPTTTTTSSSHTAAETLKAYEDKIKAQIGDAKARLEQFEAKAKDTRAQAETAAVNHLKALKENIDRKLQDLKTTHASYVASAKSEIDAEVAKFKASIDELGAKFRTAKK
jgi:F0F1-type ATP synthase membrane subunit b/b'